MASGKDKEKKKRRKSKHKDDAASSFYSLAAVEHDTAQQILVDLCTEMKALKYSMQESQEKAIANLDSNQKIVTTLVAQMDLLELSVKQLDSVIESKATPEQIEELARIRAIQEMMKVVTDDKERTVRSYEDYLRRSYEENERLRQDLVNERQEVSVLRAEIENLRNVSKHGKEIPSMEEVGGIRSRPGSMYINGGLRRLSSDGVCVGVDAYFDDLTLESKGSMDTTAHEVKSSKKRIIHMKKKLAAVQLEASESGELRAEVEKLRLQCETEKKAGLVKEKKIDSLEHELSELKINQTKDVSTSMNPDKPLIVSDSIHAKKKWWLI